jgi:hypothetical protein
MGCTKRIKGRLAALGKATKTIFLPQAVHFIPSAREYFMGISLVAHIPNQPVTRCVKHRMQRDGQFHHAKTCPKMTPSLRYHPNRLGTQFLCQRIQFPVGKSFKIGRRLNAIKQRGVRSLGDAKPSFKKALSIAGNNELCRLSQDIALFTINLKCGLRLRHQIMRTAFGSLQPQQ